MKKKFLGVCEYRYFIEAELNEDGTIKGFNELDYIHPSRSHDGNEYLSMSGWSHSVKIKGVTLKSGEQLPDKLPKVSKENQKIFDEAYTDEGGHYCSVCSVFHCSEQYYDISFVIIDCDVFCRACVEFEQLVGEPIESPDEFFKSKDVSSVEVPKEFEEVDALFCDSSGCGSPSERALTKSQAVERVTALLEEHGPLYVGVTGIGQFQVYITLWTKKKIKQKKIKRGVLNETN